MSIEGRGNVTIANTKFLIIGHTRGNIYVPLSICNTKYCVGDDLEFRAAYFDPERQPVSLRDLGVRYKATTVHWAGVPELIEDYACITFISKKIDGYLIKYGKDDVFCSRSLVTSNLELGDIVKFTAENWSSPPLKLASKGVRYKALSLDFVSKPRQIVADGYFSLIDSKGNFGYVETYLENKWVQCYITATVVYPQCSNLNERFSSNSLIRFFAMEQAANKKNNLTRFKAIVATDEKYLITSSGEVILNEDKGVRKEERTLSANSQAKEENSCCRSCSTNSNFEATEVIKSLLNSEFRNSSLTGKPDLLKKTHYKIPNDEFSNVSCIMYDDTRSSYEEENRKLRVLAHFAMDFKGCKFCLTHTHPPKGSIRSG